jgi:mono/diheme cytochrome c family protein
MKRRRFWFVLSTVVLLLGALGLVATSVTLSARGEPSQIEAYLATRAKRFLVRRSARGLEAPAFGQTSVDEGFGTYSGSCAACHRVRGRTPTEIGRGLYPPAPDLGSGSVQLWSDGELFWIIKNGIRLTGMPAFGDIHSDGEIWDLVHYLRSLGEPAEPEKRESSTAGS